MQTITGEVNKVLFFAEDSGYTVARLTAADHQDINIVGCMPKGIAGNTITATGNWKTNPKYGKQFEVMSCRVEAPSGETGLISYLSKNIPGIGPTTAKRIVDMFGDKTLDVINNTPEELVQVKGVTEKKVDAICENVTASRDEQEMLVRLQDRGLTFNEAAKIFARYKMNALNILENTPYRMTVEIKGFGFLKVDEMARKIGISHDSDERVDAGILFNLGECYQNGNMFLTLDELTKRSKGILDVEEDLIKGRITALCASGQIVADEFEVNPCFYLPALYKAECGIAKIIAQLAGVVVERYGSEKEIAAYESTLNFKLDDSQRAALACALASAVTVITGGPGTGKTTIIKGICNILTMNKMRIVLAAPTGRAAKRMTEASGYPASTIHKLLRFTYVKELGRSDFTVDDNNPIDADAIIIDEASMIDSVLMYKLLLAVKKGTRIWFVGDVDQLPSVGPGMVLSEMIDSMMIDVIRLEHIHRQDAGSQICVNADLINHGEPPVMKGADCLFVKTEDTEETQMRVLQLVKKFCQGNRSAESIQVLSAMKRGPAGCDALNEAMQNLVNPASKGKNEHQFSGRVFRSGDRILQTKNNYDIEWIGTKDGEKGKGIFNGDLGIIEDIDEKHKQIVVRFFDDKKAAYTFEQAADFVLAYSMTVHKSQGGEFPIVIIPVYGGAPAFINRTLLYTAVTRAKRKLILVGQAKALYMMIKSIDSTKRNTLLASKIMNELSSSDEVPF